MHNMRDTICVVLLVIFMCTIGLIMSVFSISENGVEQALEIIEPVVPTTESTLAPLAEPIDANEAWIYPISADEINLVALVTMAEAEGETELGKRLVIDTILNRVDHSCFPNNVSDVIYQPQQFSSMWNGRVDRCYVMSEIVELVKEELLERTNYDCIFFVAGRYGKYGKPMFQECCHYFSSYE